MGICDFLMLKNRMNNSCNSLLTQKYILEDFVYFKRYETIKLLFTFSFLGVQT